MFFEFRSTLAFRVWGKTIGEHDWRLIRVHASPSRNAASRWPFLKGCCTCWSADLIAVGSDFADLLLNDPAVAEITQESPVMVQGGTLSNPQVRLAVGAPGTPTAAEIMAHEIGHTAQARRYRFLYLPLVGAVTRFGEGPRWWNRFENEASSIGQFGGIVPGSIEMSS